MSHLTKLKIFLLLMYVMTANVNRLAAQVNFFKKDGNSASVISSVDSLNELAFKAKRYDIANALKYLETAKNIAFKNNYKKGLAVSILYEGGIFSQNGFSNKALSLYYQAHQISESLNDTFNVARANQQIAGSYINIGKLEDAESLLKQTLGTYVLLNKPEEVVNTKNSLGVIKLTNKMYADARQYFTEAWNESITLCYPYGEKKALYNLGLLYLAQEQYSAANSYFLNSLHIDSVNDDKYSMALNFIQLAKIAYEKNNISKAVKFSFYADTLATSIGAYQLRIEAMLPLIRVYKLRNEYSKANDILENIVRFQQEQSDKEKQYVANFANIIREQQEKSFQSEKAAIDAARSARNQKILLFFIGACLLIVSVMLIPTFLNYRKAKRFGKELEIKNEVIEKNAASLNHLNMAISQQNLQLEQENKMKDKLLFTISHDLRHPLVNTKSILDLINLDLVSPEESNNLFRQLTSQYIRSVSLLDNLLYWIRSHMEDIALDYASVNIYHLIQLLLEEQRLYLTSKKIEVTNNVDKAIVWRAEPEMLKIIFRNLLNNAVKFTGENGRIFIDAKRDDIFDYLIVKDTGTGITKDVIDKLQAKEYFSLKGTANEMGSGIGLLLTKDLLERHKGELLIESTPGEGSIFTVKIPANPH